MALPNPTKEKKPKKQKATLPQHIEDMKDKVFVGPKGVYHVLLLLFIYLFIYLFILFILFIFF